MKFAITGHTSGLGKFLYDKLGENHTIIGLSRSNGFDITKDFTDIVEEIQRADCFINNACVEDYQIKLFNQVCDYIPYIVSMGSHGRKYPEILGKKYAENKQNLYESIDSYMQKKYKTDCLHLDIGFLKNKDDRENSVQSTYYTTYEEIYNTIVFWLSNPCFFNIEFYTKLDEKTLEQIYKLNTLKGEKGL